MKRKTGFFWAAAAATCLIGSVVQADYFWNYGYANQPAVRYANPLGVAPLRVQNPLSSLPAGSTLTLPANFLGQQPGSVFLVFGNIKLPVKIVNWSNESVTVTLPPMAVRHPIRVRLDVVLPHGQLGLQRRFLLTRPADVVLHPTPPPSPLPTSDALPLSAIPTEN